MRRHLTFLLWLLGYLISSLTAVGQSTLSANSGINSADTWIALDMTVQTQNGSVTSSDSFYDPVAQTTSNTLSVQPLSPW